VSGRRFTIEWFIQSIQQEALDHFIVFGEQHFDHLVSQYVEYYHTERPHQAKGNVPLTGEWPAVQYDPSVRDAVVCRTRLGGLLKHYERRAALDHGEASTSAEGTAHGPEGWRRNDANDGSSLVADSAYGNQRLLSPRASCSALRPAVPACTPPGCRSG
jgi:hypothetical protein